MKLAFPIDGLLCDTESLKVEWERRLGDAKFLSDGAFWAALRPYEDSYELIEYMVQKDFYVFAVRPKSLFLPTRAWLNKHYDIHLGRDRLIIPAIKRFDCRLLGIDVFIDSDEQSIENLKIETVRPIRGYRVDRNKPGAMRKVIEEIDESFCSGD